MVSIQNNVDTTNKTATNLVLPTADRAAAKSGRTPANQIKKGAKDASGFVNAELRFGTQADWHQPMHIQMPPAAALEASSEVRETTRISDPAVVGWEMRYDAAENKLTVLVPKKFRVPVRLPRQDNTQGPRMEIVHQVSGEPNLVANFIYEHLLAPIKTGEPYEYRDDIKVKELVAAAVAFDQMIAVSVNRSTPLHYLEARQTNSYDIVNGAFSLNLYRLMKRLDEEIVYVRRGRLSIHTGCSERDEDRSSVVTDLAWPSEDFDLRISPVGFNIRELGYSMQKFLKAWYEPPFLFPDCQTRVKILLEGLASENIYINSPEGLSLVKNILRSSGARLPKALQKNWQNAMPIDPEDPQGVYRFVPRVKGFGESLILFGKNSGAPHKGADINGDFSVSKTSRTLNKQMREALNALPTDRVYLFTRNKRYWEINTSTGTPKWVPSYGGHIALAFRMGPDEPWREIYLTLDAHWNFVLDGTGSGTLEDPGCSSTRTDRYHIVILGLPLEIMHLRESPAVPDIEMFL